MARSRPIEDPRWTLGLWLLLLGGLALAVRSRFLVGADLAVAQWLAAVRSPAWDELARAITFFGSSPWTMAAVAVMAVWWWLRQAHARLVAFGAAALVGLLLEILLRFVVAQWRPDSGVVVLPLDPVSRFELAGFPSGHAFRSAYLFGWWADVCLARKSRWGLIGAIGCAALIALVGLSRLVLRRHWFTDVLGGWIVAIVALALVKYVDERAGTFTHFSLRARDGEKWKTSRHRKE